MVLQESKSQIIFLSGGELESQQVGEEALQNCARLRQSTQEIE